MPDWGANMHGSYHDGLGGTPHRFARHSPLRWAASVFAVVACVTLGVGVVGQAASAAAAC